MIWRKQEKHFFNCGNRKYSIKLPYLSSTTNDLGAFNRWGLILRGDGLFYQSEFWRGSFKNNKSNLRKSEKVVIIINTPPRQALKQHHKAMLQVAVVGGRGDGGRTNRTNSTLQCQISLKPPKMSEDNIIF